MEVYLALIHCSSPVQVNPKTHRHRAMIPETETKRRNRNPLTVELKSIKGTTTRPQTSFSKRLGRVDVS
jgi:hypothetical protein